MRRPSPGPPRSSTGGNYDRSSPQAPRSWTRALADTGSSYPDVAEWTDYFLHARATDADALAVMAPRDGRA